MLKVYAINIFFCIATSPHLPLKEFVLYTLFGVDNYGWPSYWLIELTTNLVKSIINGWSISILLMGKGREHDKLPMIIDFCLKIKLYTYKYEQ